MECSDRLTEQYLRRSNGLDRHQQRPGRIEQSVDEGIGPCRECRQHQRDADKRDEACGRLGSPYRDLRIWHLARGSKETREQLSRAGASAMMIGSCNTMPVKYSAGARRVGREPARRMFMTFLPVDYFFEAA